MGRCGGKGRCSKGRWVTLLGECSGVGNPGTCQWGLGNISSFVMIGERWDGDVCNEGRESEMVEKRD